jgi:PTH1 family peptidyl-tRNA hydrolase
VADPPGLIVGLGNTGGRYASSRHNAGFWFVDRIAHAAGVVFRPESRFFGEVARIDRAGRPLWLLKPSTFMNRSGSSVAAFANYYRMAVTELLVAHDDLDLAPGTVRLKSGGGHGGHNGLRDIVAHLGSAEFMRLRIGIGHPEPDRDVTAYVLGNPSGDDREGIELAIGQTLDQFDAIAAGEYGAVMNILHRRSKDETSGSERDGGTDPGPTQN